MPGRIIVPLDGSKFAEDALAKALTLTDKSSRLDLVTVVEGPTALSGTEYVMQAKEWAASYLEDVIEKLPPTVKAHPHVLVGAPTQRIREFIDESNADLVVMASHGRGLLSRAWLGSMADYLIRTSSVPLLLLHPTADQEPSYQADRPIRRILVPLDGSELAEAATQGAPEVFGPEIELTLFRAVRYPIYSASGFVPDTMHVTQDLVQQANAEARDYLTETAWRLRTKVDTVETEVTVSDSPTHAILDYAENNDFDAIAIATHGRGGIPRLALGSVADKVIRQASVPVLTFRPREAKARTDSKVGARGMISEVAPMTGQ